MKIRDMQRNIVTRSPNHCCSRKQQYIMWVLLSSTSLSTIIITILNVAQQCCYNKCTSPATIKRT
jgi:hypothetical protein